MNDQMTIEEVREWREILKQLTHDQKVYLHAFALELRENSK